MPTLLFFDDFPTCQRWADISKGSLSFLTEECRRLLKKSDYINERTMLCVITDGDDWQVCHPVISDLKGGTTHPRGNGWYWLSGKSCSEDEKAKNHKAFTIKLKAHMNGQKSPPMTANSAVNKSRFLTEQTASATKHPSVSSKSQNTQADIAQEKSKLSLNDIIQDFLNDFNQKQDWDYVVRPSIPVVWFGNMEKYLASKVKIVTVALNPSDKEFLLRNKEEPRFDVPAGEIQTLSTTLNNYFSRNPYPWFRHFEFVLNCFHASYYERNDPLLDRTAIHIDIHSAIATNPTWGELNPQQQKDLMRPDLFHRLLGFLDPDLIIYSGDIRIFNENFPSSTLDYEQRLGNRGYIRKYSCDNWTIVTGYNCHGTPFGGMSREGIHPVLMKIDQDLEKIWESRF